MGDLQFPWATILPNLNHCNHVQPEQGEIIQVVRGQGFTSEMGVYQSQATKPAGPSTKTSNLRDMQLFSISDNHVAHRSIPAHQHSNLTANLVRYRSQVVSKFWGHNQAGINFSPIGSFQCFDLSGLNSKGVPKYLSNPFLLLYLLI
jgi:hypothetical protein